MDLSKPFGIAKTLIKLFKYLSARRTRRFWIILIGMVFVALLETLTAGVIAFYAATVADPQTIIQQHLPRLQTILPGIASMDVRGIITLLSIGVVLLVIIKNIAQAAVTYASKFFSANISGYLGEYMLRGFMNMPYEWHLHHNSADLIQGIEWRRYFGDLITASLKALSDILIVFILLSTLFIVNPTISLIVFLTLGGTALLIVRYVRRSMDRLARIHRDYNQSINREVTKAMHGIKEVKIYDREQAFTEKYDSEVYQFARTDARLNFTNQLPAWFLEIMGVAMLAISIWIMFFYFGDSSVKITGTIALLAVASWRILPAMSRILNSTTTVRQSMPYVHRGLEYLDDIAAHPVPAFRGNDLDTFKQELKLNNISFTYNKANRPVLKDISLTIPCGQTMGIIGPSGAGKSTMVDIIIGLLQPSSGGIYLDGRKLTPERVKSWQKLLGYVPQFPYIAPATLAENVAFGIPHADIDRTCIEQCCHMAAMDDFLYDLPQGINSFLGERGVKLSGGQRQRVAIARALYHSPEVIIFDEATSALDTKNEQAVQQTIYSLKDKMTLIIIAHRLSTVKDCDTVVWLENGRIEMFGDTEIVLNKYKQTHAGSIHY
ncbi:MAG: ABC transporter ATP-binding protein [Thermodesulfobacteriota bacterium]|nr:ABC transporter ATP-binding protein [Thermodesulfobacteriota bacterium]